MNFYYFATFIFLISGSYVILLIKRGFFLSAFAMLPLMYSLVVKSPAKYYLDAQIGVGEIGELISLDTMLTPTFFFIVFIFGSYCSLLGKEGTNKFTAISTDLKVLYIGERYYLIIIACLFGLLFIGSGSDWLATNRSSVASLLSNFRYIYPFIMILTIMYVAKSLARVQTVSLIQLMYLLSLLFLIFSLLSLRGWFIAVSIIIVSSYLHVNNSGLFKKIAYLAFFMFLGTTLKDIFLFLFTEGDFLSPISLDRISTRAAGGFVDVFYVVEEYIKENGYEYGAGTLGFIFHIFPLNIRLDIFSSSSDIINIFINEYRYVALGFGYNVGSLQDAYLNFGYFGIFIAFFLGYFMTYHEYRLWLSYYQIGYFSVTRFFTIFFFVNYGSVKWIIVAIIVELLLIRRKYEHNKS